MSDGDLKEQHCKPCEGGVEAMTEAEIEGMLQSIPGWLFENGRLQREFVFKNHYQAVSFVNAIAWISHVDNHHPLITLGFKDVRVEYWTHAIAGISENDFICAAKVSHLLSRV